MENYKKPYIIYVKNKRRVIISSPLFHKTIINLHFYNTIISIQVFVVENLALYIEVNLDIVYFRD